MHLIIFFKIYNIFSGVMKADNRLNLFNIVLSDTRQGSTNSTN